MSESDSQKLNTVILCLLLLICAALLWLDWQKHQEIEGLHARVDGLSPPQPLRVPVPPAPPGPAEPQADPPPGFGAAPAPPAPQQHPLIRAVLAAHTDGELSTFGNGAG